MLAIAESLAIGKPNNFTQSDAASLRANLQTVLAIRALHMVRSYLEMTNLSY